MKKTFIKDIREKEHVTGQFLVSKKESGISKTGKAYLTLRIMDSSGELEARVWDDAEELAKRFQKNDVCRIKGYAVSYQGGVQVNVSDIIPLAEKDYAIRDFLPASSKDPAEMITGLDAIIAAMDDKNLKALLTSIFDDADIRALFMAAPAAKAYHHPYLGGLLEHVLSMCGLVKLLSAHYNSNANGHLHNMVNEDLLLSGAILHDIGKIHELTYKRAFDYTDEGKLLGHISIGVGLIDKKIAAMPDFPAGLAVHLKHLILSHHEKLEFGSPVRPATLEAILLCYIDNMDAKVTAIRALITQPGEGIMDESNWTPFQKMFEGFIFKGQRANFDGSDSGPANPHESATNQPAQKPIDKSTNKPDDKAGKKDLPLFGK